MSISTLTSNISANVLADLTVDGAGRHQITSERFDFGSGPVPAARHRNPDGSVGGWVAVSAHVDSAEGTSMRASPWRTTARRTGRDTGCDRTQGPRGYSRSTTTCAPSARLR